MQNGNIEALDVRLSPYIPCSCVCVLCICYKVLQFPFFTALGLTQKWGRERCIPAGKRCHLEGTSLFWIVNKNPMNCDISAWSNDQRAHRESNLVTWCSSEQIPDMGQTPGAVHCGGCAAWEALHRLQTEVALLLGTWVSGIYSQLHH